MEFSSMCYISHRLKYLPTSFNIKSQGIFLCYEKVGILEKYNYQDIDKDEVKELIVAPIGSDGTPMQDTFTSLMDKS